MKRIRGKGFSEYCNALDEKKFQVGNVVHVENGNGTDQYKISFSEKLFSKEGGFYSYQAIGDRGWYVDVPD